jgi:hypothetical protein
MEKTNKPPSRLTGAPKTAEPFLRGSVQRYFSDVRLGSIKSDAGKIYNFKGADWLTPATTPQVGVRIMFEQNGALAVKIQVED